MTREEFISMMGFSDNSPLRNAKSLPIRTGPNGIIDMSNTGMPLMANGRYLPPYSGHHQFDPNSIVTEIPLAQTGFENSYGFQVSQPSTFTGTNVYENDEGLYEVPFTMPANREITGGVIENTLLSLDKSKLDIKSKTLLGNFMKTKLGGGVIFSVPILEQSLVAAKKFGDVNLEASISKELLNVGGSNKYKLKGTHKGDKSFTELELEHEPDVLSRAMLIHSRNFGKNKLNLNLGYGKGSGEFGESGFTGGIGYTRTFKKGGSLPKFQDVGQFDINTQDVDATGQRDFQKKKVGSEEWLNRVMREQEDRGNAVTREQAVQFQTQALFDLDQGIVKSQTWDDFFSNPLNNQGQFDYGTQGFNITQPSVWDPITQTFIADPSGQMSNTMLIQDYEGQNPWTFAHETGHNWNWRNPFNNDPSRQFIGNTYLGKDNMFNKFNPDYTSDDFDHNRGGVGTTNVGDFGQYQQASPELRSEKAALEKELFDLGLYDPTQPFTEQHLRDILDSGNTSSEARELLDGLGYKELLKERYDVIQATKNSKSSGLPTDLRDKKTVIERMYSELGSRYATNADMSSDVWKNMSDSDIEKHNEEFGTTPREVSDGYGGTETREMSDLEYESHLRRQKWYADQELYGQDAVYGETSLTGGVQSPGYFSYDMKNISDANETLTGYMDDFMTSLPTSAPQLKQVKNVEGWIIGYSDDPNYIGIGTPDNMLPWSPENQETYNNQAYETLEERYNNQGAGGTGGPTEAQWNTFVDNLFTEEEGYNTDDPENTSFMKIDESLDYTWPAEEGDDDYDPDNIQKDNNLWDLCWDENGKPNGNPDCTEAHLKRLEDQQTRHTNHRKIDQLSYNANSIRDLFGTSTSIHVENPSSLFDMSGGVAKTGPNSPIIEAHYSEMFPEGTPEYDARQRLISTMNGLHEKNPDVKAVLDRESLTPQFIQDMKLVQDGLMRTRKSLQEKRQGLVDEYYQGVDKYRSTDHKQLIIEQQEELDNELKDNNITNFMNRVYSQNDQEISDNLPPVTNARYGRELPRFQKKGGYEGLRGSEINAINNKLFSGEYDVADKYQPVVDWYENYLYSGTFEHLKNKTINNTASPWDKNRIKNLLETGEKQGKQYATDYPYRMRHAYEDTWKDEMDYSVIKGPSIEEKKKTLRNYNTNRNKISIDPLNDTFGPYNIEQQLGIMAYELGDIAGKSFIGDKSLEAQINKKNKAFQTLYNKLSKEEKQNFIDNPNELDWWLEANYKEPEFQDAQTNKVRADVIRFRYQADKAGIYGIWGDPYTGEYIKFTEDDLKKMKEEHPENKLFKNFEDKDIIWLMDNVADATDEIKENQDMQNIGMDDLQSLIPTTEAKFGKELPRFQKKGEYDWEIATERSIYPDGEFNYYNPADYWRYFTNENETVPIPAPPPEDPESAKNKSEIPLSWDEYKIEKPSGTIEQFRRYIRNPKYKDWRMNIFSPYTNRTKKGWANKEYYRGLDEEGVGEVQEWLIEQGYDIKKDNGWGDQTYNALNNYLLDNKLLNKEITTDPLLTDDLLITQQYIESDGKPKAGSNKGAQGLVQAMEGAWKDAIKKGILPENADRTNINHSLVFQRYYMNGLMNAGFVKDGTSDNEKLARALSAYNWGRGNTPNFFNNINYVATDETIKDKDGKVIESGFRNKLDKEGNPILVPEDERRDPLDMDSWMTILDTDKESTRWTIPKETVDYINLIMDPDKYIEMYGKKQYESRIKSTKKFEDYKKKAKKFYSYKEGGSVNRTKQLIRTYKLGGELSGLTIKHLEEIGVIPQYKEGGTTHTINDEEALLGIAKEYNTTEKDINKYNNLIDTESLYKGQVLNIPEPIAKTPLEIKKEKHKLGDYGTFKNMTLDTQIKLYSNYVNGDYMIFSEKLGKKLYDKLNRVYYDKARVLNMSVLDYMKSILS